MANIKKCETLLKRVSLINLIHGNDGLSLTPLFVGAHGLGKTKFHNSAAKALGSKGCYTIDCSQVGEGDISGIPFAQKNEDGTSEVRFIKYYIFNKLWRIEKEYYDKAITTGFLNGRVRLEIDAEGNQWLIDGDERKMVRTKMDIIEDGEDNIYKFGDELSGKTKLELLESGEIGVKIILLDELNRADMTVFRNVMNIILEREVNGYKLPFWTQLSAAINPCSQNSSYATSELDPAQLSRFIKIRVSANLEEWVDYAMNKRLAPEVVEGLALSEAIFNQKDASTEDTSEMGPDPRAWEMVCKMYSTIYKMNIPKFFSPEEMRDVDTDLRILITGKVGDTAGRTLLEAIARRENNIKPADIFTLKEPKLSAAVVDKFHRQKSLTQRIIADNVVFYMAATVFDLYKNQSKTEGKPKWANFMGQLREFINMLSPADQLIFLKKILAQENGKQLYFYTAKAYAADVIKQLTETETGVKDLTSDK